MVGKRGKGKVSRKKKPVVDERILHELIEKKAYELYEKRGKQEGRALDDWLEAERIIKEEYQRG
ncbi:MAG: hypothetical protein KatS3mg078_1504 [Deltaproteobacteria bacterium]|jgi:hypothetical protein|nr:MAG: hypothetical protein KatS3mg078_1504 [Deltaproteobacteria bacterium]